MSPSAAVAVLVPVLGRPDRAAPLLRSLRASEGHARLHPVFLCSPGDTEELVACRAACTEYSFGYRSLRQALALEVDWPAGPGDYARKINYGFAVTDEPYIFMGADDLCFCPRWADEALAVAARTGKRVIGTNDLGNDRTIQGSHSTHSLVARSYVLEHGTIDQPGLVLHEGYDHNFCDTELVATARRRNEFAHAPRSMVEHLHPHWGKGRDDATYRKGQRSFELDRRLHASRAPLWR